MKAMKSAERFPGGPAASRGSIVLAALVLLTGCTPSPLPTGGDAHHGGEKQPAKAKKRNSGQSSGSRSNGSAALPNRDQRPVGSAPPPPPPAPERARPRKPPPPQPLETSLPAAFATQGPVPEKLQALVAEARRRRAVRAVGVAVVDLARGQAYGVAPHRIFRPASVIKLAVMVGAYRAAREMPPRAFDRLRPDIRRMITLSDNPSTTRLVRRLGKARINATMGALGLPGIALQPKPSARGVLVGSRADAAEVALLLAKLAERQVISRPASEEMLLLLGAQHRRSRIPAGLTAQRGVWVGNKTGTLPGLVHDAGIVIDAPSGLAYTLAIFTEGAPSERAGERLCAAISAEVYRLLRALRAAGPPG
jgi:beta-lactamase class A